MIVRSPPAILFVCLGNICRSPLAEAALRKHARIAGLAIDADSAGTGDWHIGQPPDRRAQVVALSNGIDISSYRARQIEPGDFDRFTHIFALDHENLAAIRAIAPDRSSAEISLLLDVVEGRTGEAVADPYYGDANGFEKTWAHVDASAQALVNHFQSR